MTDEEAFWAFVQLMKIHQLDTVYRHNLIGLNHLCKVFDQQVERNLPRVYARLVICQ